MISLWERASQEYKQLAAFTATALIGVIGFNLQESPSVGAGLSLGVAVGALISAGLPMTDVLYDEWELFRRLIDYLEMDVDIDSRILRAVTPVVYGGLAFGGVSGLLPETVALGLLYFSMGGVCMVLAITVPLWLANLRGIFVSLRGETA